MTTKDETPEETPAPAIEGQPILTPGRDGGTAIVGALIETMKAIGVVGKERRHTGKQGEGSTGQWNYRSGDDVVNAVQPALVEANVLNVPTVRSHSRTKLGNSSCLELQLRYTLISGEDGSSLAVDVISHGVGNTAFTTGAAMSYGLKYALSQLFMIPFDDTKLDLESNAHADMREGTTVLEMGPGSWVADGDLQNLLTLIKSETPELQAAFKSEAQERNRPDYSWSFASSHRWRYSEWREAMAWVLSQRQAEAFADGEPGPDPATTDVATGEKIGHTDGQAENANQSAGDDLEGSSGDTADSGGDGANSQDVGKPESEPVDARSVEHEPMLGWEPPATAAWTRHGKKAGVTMRALFKAVNADRGEDDQIGDVNDLRARPTLAKTWWDWVATQAEKNEAAAKAEAGK